MTQKQSQANGSNYAICYYRSSSCSQSEVVIEQQREAVRSWARANGYEILREYQDVGKPGIAADRSGYERMVAEVSTLRPSVLLLWKADRLARDRHEFAATRKALADAGCRVCYVAEAVPDDDSPEAALMESMLDGMADYYSK